MVKSPAFLLVGCLGLTLAASVQFCAADGRPNVQLVRTPEGGVQPQVAVDDRGTVHLIYLRGDPRAADIIHGQRARERREFSPPVRVNSEPGTAVAMGTIRGAQLAAGRNGRVYVVWNGPQPAGAASAPFFFARLNDAGTAFEPQRNLMTWTAGLDGGGSVAADGQGNVYVFWHGRDGSAAGPKGETSRAVFVACSHDDGKTFERERRANPDPTGACGCCGMKAMADGEGNVCALYRAARSALNRDMMALVSRDGGATFAGRLVQAWSIGACPMSSASLVRAKGGVLAAWETKEQVYFSRFTTGTFQMSPRVAPPGSGARKHPAVAGNSRGEVLLAWAEGTGWQKGGRLAWQVFDAGGRPQGESQRVDGVPVWSLPAVWVEPDDSFVIVH